MSIGDPIRQRIERVTRMLREAGFPDVVVDAEGQEREIAAVRVPPQDWERLAGPDGARVADEVKAAGFRYVALDLLPSESPPVDPSTESSAAASGEIPSDAAGGESTGAPEESPDASGDSPRVEG